MKTQNYLILSTLFLLLLFSCRKDQFTVEKGELATLTEAHLTGLIVSSENQPIPNAKVSVLGSTTQTDKNGVFILRDIEISNNGTLVKVEKIGYFDGFFFVFGREDEQSYLEGILIEKQVQEFQSSNGATITINGGANITFDQNSIMTGGGQPYNGAVNISAHWYDPSSNETGFSMPGDLRGRDQNADLVQLVTYGMMAVDLRSPAGIELQLATDAKAVLKFPISDDADIGPSEVIPMWYLDEDTGTWVEEGTSTVEGDFLVGEVSHFSFWNCDLAFPVVDITGRLVAADGTPFPFQTVLIKDNNNNISRSGTTNESGIFKGKVPANVDLSLFHYVCNGARAEVPLGVLTEDTDIGEIILDAENSTTLLATLENCEMQPITTGYVKLTSPTTTKIVTTSADGILDYPFFHCGETDVTMVAYDFSTPINSEILTIETNQTEQDLGTVYLCDSIPGEYIRYLINGQSHARPLDKVETYVVDDRYLYIYAYHSFSTTGVGPSSMLFKYDILNEVAQYFPRGYTASGQQLETSGNNLAVEASAIGGVGSFVTLTFDNGVFQGDLKVYIDKIIESGLVRGKVWLDENNNGLQEANEQSLAGRRILMHYVQGGFISAAGYSLHPQPNIRAVYVFSDNNGNFEFTGVFTEQLFRLTFNSNPGETLTLTDVGNNDSIDSDFYDRFNALDQYDTDDFILEPGGEKIDFGLGIKQ